MGKGRGQGHASRVGRAKRVIPDVGPSPIRFHSTREVRALSAAHNHKKIALPVLHWPVAIGHRLEPLPPRVLGRTAIARSIDHCRRSLAARRSIEHPTDVLYDCDHHGRKCQRDRDLLYCRTAHVRRPTYRPGFAFSPKPLR
jgi:hypothetical protein